MKTIEFKTKLAGNTILIPENFQPELSLSNDKYIRVIILLDELEKSEEAGFKFLSHGQFLKGYDEADSVYDTL